MKNLDVEINIDGQELKKKLKIKDGLDGKDGKDGKQGQKGERGLRGLQGIQGKDGKDGLDGQDGSPDTGVEIVSKINDLPVSNEKNKIDATHIKGLTEAVTSWNGGRGDMFKNVYDPAGGNRQVAFADELNQLEDLAIAYAVAL